MPEKIGPYSIVSQLGRGGMGVVYKGRDESLNRFVAIKVLTENLSEDPTFLQRFIREAQAAASLSHPNVVQIYYTGQDEEGHPYFVMEYVAGQSLDQLLRSEGRIDNPRASQLMLQAAHGLAAAHDLGIIHRDIKPANLMLDERGTVKIADFGLALPADAANRLTQTGMFVGTPGYFSPEQCAGEKADHRTDIYALGITYYMLLTGTPPFRGESPLALIKQILDATPPDVTSVNPNIDPESRRILTKMIAKEREQRYQNCHELVADLENLLGAMGVRSMTAGLGTRSSSSSPAAAVAAASTPTMVVTAPAVAPLAVPPKAEVTVPEMPMAAAPTMPVVPLMPATPAAPATQPPVVKKGSSSRTVLIAALLAFVLLAGGAIAAVMYGTKFFRRGPQEAEARFAVAAPASNPPQSTEASLAGTTPASNPQDALLSQGISTGTNQAAGPGGTQPATEPQNQLNASGSSSQSPGQSPEQSSGQALQPANPQAVPRERATPITPAREPRRRALSGVAVAAIGDQVLLGAVSGVLRAEAGAAGLEAVDAHALPSTEDMLQGRVALRDLLAQLRDDGYAVLMLARIEPTGQRELSYYGRRDTAYSSRVTVTAYDLASGRPFGTPQTGSLTYTSINAGSESEDVVTPLARATARMIRDR